jgi:hypothetical protein
MVRVTDLKVFVREKNSSRKVETIDNVTTCYKLTFEENYELEE